MSKQAYPPKTNEPVPFSPEAEEAVLGAILTNGNAFFTAATILIADDFYLLRHRYIWQAMQELSQTKEGIDHLTLSKHLRDVGQLDEIGNTHYLIQLVNNTPSSTMIEEYAHIVADAAARRRLLDAADQMKALALAEHMDVKAIVAEAENKLDAVRRDEHNTILHGRDSNQVYNTILDERKRKRDAGELVSYPLPEYWYALREKLPTLQSGKMVVISGGEGSGKSSAMESLAEHIAHQTKVAYVFTEMTEEDILDRRMARHAQISYFRLIDNTLTAEEEERKFHAEQHIHSWADNITYLKMPNVPFRTLQSELRRLEKRGVKVFFIDHFQDIAIEVPKGTNDIRAIEAAVTWLTSFAEKRNVLLVLGSQENADGGTMWSAKLRQKAALRISISRKELDQEYSYWVNNAEFRSFPGEESPEAWWYISKSRFGKKGKVKMINHGPGFEWLDVKQVVMLDDGELSVKPKRRAASNPFSKRSGKELSQ